MSSPTARLSAPRFVSVAFCSPYLTIVHHRVFYCAWEYFCTFHQPCSCWQFWVGLYCCFFFLLCVYICSCKTAPCWALWQPSGPAVRTSLCNSLTRWTMHLQAFGGTSHRINQAFVCFAYLFLVTNFIHFSFLYSLLSKREAGMLNVNLEKCT